MATDRRVIRTVCFLQDRFYMMQHSPEERLIEESTVPEFLTEGIYDLKKRNGS